MSVIWAVYGQPEIMEKQWESLRRLPPLVKARLELVVVDDHGRPEATIPDDIVESFPCQLLRVEKDIPWNQMGARNLGMHVCRSRVAVMLDPDMVPNTLTWDRLLNQARLLRKGTVVKFSLRYLDGRPEHTSPNTWIITKEDFWEIGGYDEDYAGNKGWSDVQLMHTIQSRLRVVHRKRLQVDYWLDRDGVPNSQVTSLDRDVRTNARKHKAKWNEVKRRFGGNWGRWAQKHRPKVLRFPWKRLIYTHFES